MVYNYNYFVEMLDLFGPSYNLEHKTSSRYRSISGSIISLLILVSCTILCFMVGKEIYEKKQPIISASQKYINDSTIYFNQLPILFKFSITNGEDISDFSLYYDTFIYSTSMETNNKVTTSTEKYGLTECTNKEFYSINNDTSYNYNDVSSSNSSLPSGTYYCVDFTNSTLFRNEYLTTDSIGVNIGLKLKSFDHLPKFEAEKLKYNRQKILLTIYYLNSYLDFNSNKVPINVYYDMFNIELNDNYFRRAYVRFVKGIFIADNGWIFEDYSDSYHFAMQSYIPDDLIIPETGILKDMIFLLSLESSRITNHVKRSYIKIQDVFAKVGGVINAIIIAMKILTNHYFRFKYLSFLKVFIEDLEKQNDKKVDRDFPLKSKTIDYEIMNKCKTLDDKGIRKIRLSLKDSISNINVTQSSHNSQEISENTDEINNNINLQSIILDSESQIIRNDNIGDSLVSEQISNRKKYNTCIFGENEENKYNSILVNSNNSKSIKSIVDKQTNNHLESASIPEMNESLDKTKRLSINISLNNYDIINNNNNNNKEISNNKETTEQTNPNSTKSLFSSGCSNENKEINNINLSQYTQQTNQNNFTLSSQRNILSKPSKKISYLNEPNLDFKSNHNKNSLALQDCCNESNSYYYLNAIRDKIKKVTSNLNIKTKENEETNFNINESNIKEINENKKEHNNISLDLSEKSEAKAKSNTRSNIVNYSEKKLEIRLKNTLDHPIHKNINYLTYIFALICCKKHLLRIYNYQVSDVLKRFDIERFVIL